MHLRSLFGPIALSFLLAWMVTLFGAPAFAADDDIQLIPQGSTTDAPAPAPAAAPAAGELEIRGMHCTPDAKEVETLRPIPIACTVDYPVSGVELRYRLGDTDGKWEKIELTPADSRYTGTIPCGVTSKPGAIKLYLFARNENNKVVARIGRRETPLSIRVVEQSKAAPPALPGQKAPQRCYDENACPLDLVGTAVCPGTHVAKSAKKGWGANCKVTSECGNGLECIKDTCEEPAKCDDAKDCSEGGECVDGKCHVPDAEELKGQLGPPKHHWFGLHVGTDFLFMSEGSSICGPDSSGADAQKFACFQGGNEYAGTPNALYAGHLSSKVAFATIRALLSYDYMVGRLSIGARLGWAIRGAPKGFSPIHIEARIAYSLRKDPFKQNFRPYLGLAVGHAQVDGSGTTTIVDCVSHDPACVSAKSTADINGYLADPNQALIRKLDAYRSGAPFFFGPTLSIMYAFTNEASLVFNLNAMFPDITLEPTIGYSQGF